MDEVRHRDQVAGVAVGQAVERVPLPAIKDKIVIHKPPPHEERPRVEVPATEQERAQLEKLDWPTGEFVLKRRSLSHPFIVQARAILGRATADNRKIVETGQPCLDIRVSKSSLDRALRIMAGLIGVIEAEGFTTAVGNGHREHTVATIYGHQVKFGIVERVDRVDLASAPSGGVLERVLSYGGKPVSYEPNGQLSIEVWHPWDASPRRWKDKKSHRLEEMLPQVVAGFIRIALTQRAEQEKLRLLLSAHSRIQRK